MLNADDCRSGFPRIGPVSLTPARNASPEPTISARCYSRNVGSTYCNISVRGPDQSVVEQTILDCGASALLLETDRGLVVFPTMETAGELTQSLSKVADVVVLVAVHDSDFLFFSVLLSGELKGRWMTPPEAAAGLGDDNEGPEGINTMSPVPSLAALDPPDITRAANILEGKTPSVFADELHADLVDALGLPDEAVGQGRSYLQASINASDLQPDFLDRLTSVGVPLAPSSTDSDRDPPPFMLQFNPTWGDPDTATSPKFEWSSGSYPEVVANSDGEVLVEQIACFASVGSKTQTVHVGVQGPLFDEGLATLESIVIHQWEGSRTFKTTDGLGAVVSLTAQEVLDDQFQEFQRTQSSNGTVLRPSARDFEVSLVLSLHKTGAAGFHVTAQTPGLEESMGHTWIEAEVDGTGPLRIRTRMT